MLQFLKNNHPMILIFLGALLSAAGAISYQIKGSRTTKQIMETQNKALNYITGGDSFCYLSLSSDGQFFTVIHQGDFPLYDVSIRIVDLDLFERGDVQPTQVPLGTIIPKSVVVIPYKFAYANKDKAKYTVIFVARNGMFSESLELKKIKGVWKSAVHVGPGLCEYGEMKKSFEFIDEGFNVAEQVQE